MARRRKQDVVASLRGIAAVIATLLTFVVILMILVAFERLVFG